MIALLYFGCLYVVGLVLFVAFIAAIFRGADRMEEELEEQLAWKRKVIEAGGAAGYDDF